MTRSLLSAVVALLIGTFIGWQARYFPAGGPEGIQWKFNEAARRGDIHEMKKLMAAGADPLAIPSCAKGAVTGQTALLVAASAGEPASVEFLIGKGANVNRWEADVRPLGAAEYRLRQAEATVRILRSHGATQQISGKEAVPSHSDKPSN